ncbi:probable Siderophore iron transporter ARN1 [Zygosaccharomyces bailii ISA1307]|nr:probable Siderophore iron transporter ARN1 [Zygosaccharomyces bailii ISA1307]
MSTEGDDSFIIDTIKMASELRTREEFVLGHPGDVALDKAEHERMEEELEEEGLQKVNPASPSNAVEITESDGEKQFPEELNEYGLPDRLGASRRLIIRRSELMAAQYDAWPYRLLLLFCAFLCGYGYGLDGNIRYIYTSYVLSSFGEHSLISTINVINAVISAAAQIFYARLSDLFGRLWLFITAIIFYAMGTIIQSQSYDIERYAAGSIFYNLGYVGIILVLLLIMSDFSSLKWRLLYQFVPTWPFIINTWISGNVTSAANPQKNWSWDIAMWTFIFPLSCLPLICCMLHMWYKASKTEEWKLLNEEKTYFQTHGLISYLRELFWRLDSIGLFILAISLGCLLVPLTLAGGVNGKWRNPHLIGPICLGGALIPVLLLYELKWAREPILPWRLIKDRAVWSAMGISFLIDFIFYMAADYLYTVLIVAVDESVESATRISSLSSFVSTVFSPLFSLYITRCTRLKPYIIAGCGIWMLAMGLLYHFRGGKDSHSGIIGGLCVWGVGTTLFTYPVNVSVQSAVSHENMATVTALNYTLYRIGSAVGSAVSGSVWTQTLYRDLLKRISDPKIAALAYESPYDFVAAYAWGTPYRDAAVESYRYVQRLLTIIAIVFCAPLMFFSLCLRNSKLTDEIAHENLKEGEVIDREEEDPVFEWMMRHARKVIPGLRNKEPEVTSEEGPDIESDSVEQKTESEFKKLKSRFRWKKSPEQTEEITY